MKVAIDIRRAGDFGVGTYIRNIINELAHQDRDSRYLLIGEPRHMQEIDPLPDNFELVEFSAPLGSAHSQVRLPLLLTRHGVELLHIPWFYAPAALPCPLVITVHDLTDFFYPPPGTARVVQAARLHFARRALVKARRILAVSQATRRELSRAFHIPETKIEVIYNALDERFAHEPPPADPERVLERHAVNFPFVLYAGNIKPQKNLTRLIEAFAVAKAELADHPEFEGLKLLLIGDELTKHPDLRRAVVRTRVREDVRFMGFVPHDVLRVFYSKARAFLFPSLYEGFGLPPLEAMAHGTPVLTSNVSSLPEVLDHAALLVNPENVFDIARGIRQVLTDEALRRQLIERGHEQLRKYSWERSARQVLDVYRSVAAARGSAR